MRCRPIQMVCGLGALAVAAQAGDQVDHLGQLRWLLGPALPVHRRPDRLPFRRLEDGLAVRPGALPARPADEHRPPRDDQADRQARQDPLHILEPPPFDSAARFPRAKEDLDAPPHLVPLHDPPNVFGRGDRQRRQQQPLDRLLTGRRVRLTDRHHVHRNRRQNPIRPPRRSQRHRRRPHRHRGLPRFPRPAPGPVLDGRLGLPPADRQFVRLEHRRCQHLIPQTPGLFGGARWLHRPVLAPPNQPIDRRRAPRFGEELVDVPLTVRDAQEADRRHLLGQSARFA